MVGGDLWKIPPSPPGAVAALNPRQRRWARPVGRMADVLARLRCDARPTPWPGSSHGTVKPGPVTATHTSTLPSPSITRPVVAPRSRAATSPTHVELGWPGDRDIAAARHRLDRLRRPVGHSGTSTPPAPPDTISSASLVGGVTSAFRPDRRVRTPEATTMALKEIDRDDGARPARRSIRSYRNAEVRIDDRAAHDPQRRDQIRGTAARRRRQGTVEDLSNPQGSRALPARGPDRIDQGVWIDPRSGRVTLAEWTAEWQRTVVDLRPTTQRIYDANLRNHILPDLGTIELGRLTPSLLRAWPPNCPRRSAGGGRPWPLGRSPRPSEP